MDETHNLDEMLTETFQALKKAEGKKLLWTAKDNDAGCVYLVFDDLTAVSISDANELADGPGFCQRYLTENLAAAKSIVTLQDIVAKLMTPAPADAETPAAQGGLTHES